MENLQLCVYFILLSSAAIQLGYLFHSAVPALELIF